MRSKTLESNSCLPRKAKEQAFGLGFTGQPKASNKGGFIREEVGRGCWRPI